MHFPILAKLKMHRCTVILIFALCTGLNAETADSALQATGAETKEMVTTGYSCFSPYSLSVIYLEQPIAEIRAYGSNKVVEGSHFSLSCVVSGVPEPNIQWKFQSSTDNNKSGILPQFAGLHNITISNISRSDAGQYSCIVDTGVGEPVTAFSDDIRVSFPPEVHNEKHVFVATVGGKTQLTCNFTAAPATNPGESTWNKLKWFRVLQDNTTVQEIERSSSADFIFASSEVGYDVTSWLMISAVREEYLTTYKCRYTDSLGSAEGVLELSDGSIMQPLNKNTN